MAEDREPKEEKVDTTPDAPGSGPQTGPGAGGPGTGSAGPGDQSKAQGDAGGTLRPPLARSTTERWIAGVASGLGAHFNIDPVVIRVAFVLLVFAGGVGVPLYLAGWLLIPKENETASLGESLLDRARQSPAWMVLLVLIGGALLLMALPPWHEGTILWALLLIAGGVWLYRWDAEGRPTRATGHRSAESAIAPEGAARAGSIPRAPELATPWQPVAPLARAPRPHSYLGRYTFAVALLVIGLAAILDNAGVISIGPQHYPALALLVVGLGLLVGAVWGKSRGLIFLGLLVVPFAFTGSLINVPLEGEVGQRFYAPVSVTGGRGEYRMVAGELNLDLTKMRFGSEPVEIDTSMAFGETFITVPSDVTVEFHGTAGAGELVAFGERRGGTDVELQTVERGGDAGHLILNADTSFGSVQVTKALTLLPTPPLPPPTPPAPPSLGGLLR